MVSVHEWLQRTEGKSLPRGAQKEDGNLPSVLRSNISHVLSDTCSFRPRERLRGRNSFRDVFKHGRTFSLGSITLHYLTETETIFPSELIQVGFTVTKPTNKVKKNYLRRVLRELARNEKPRIRSFILQEQSPLKLIFNVDSRKIHRSTSFKSMQDDFLRILDKFSFERE